MNIRKILSASALVCAFSVPALADNMPSVVMTENMQASVPLVTNDVARGIVTYVAVNPAMTAKGMLGEPVFDNSGDQIATVDDIIVNETGEATMVIVGEGGVLGIGEKLAAFDYNLVTHRDANGDLILPLGQNTMERAMRFSYDSDDADDKNTVIMPATSYRLSDILDAEVMDPLGNEIAEVDNATLHNGRVEFVVLDLDNLMGADDQHAAMPYGDLAKSTLEGELDFRLTAEQGAVLENFARMTASGK